MCRSKWKLPYAYYPVRFFATGSSAGSTWPSRLYRDYGMDESERVASLSTEVWKTEIFLPDFAFTQLVIVGITRGGRWRAAVGRRRSSYLPRPVSAAFFDVYQTGFKIWKKFRTSQINPLIYPQTV